MSTTDLKKLVQELKIVKKRADTDLDAIPYQTRMSIANMKREAQDQLVGLKTKYAQAVRSNSVGMFLIGDPQRQKDFAKIAAEEVGTINVAADALYERIANRVEGSLGASKEFSVSQLAIMIGTLRDIEKDLDILHMPTPVLLGERVTPTHGEVVDYVRYLMRNVLGDDMIRLYVDRTVNEKAIEAEFANNTLPVVVTGATAEETTTLGALFTASSTVPVGTSEDGEVTKEYVLNQLNSIKKKIKRTSN